MSLLRPDILVIGLDPAGLECALGAALARLPVVVVTQNQHRRAGLGGLDILNRIRALGGKVIEAEARFRDRHHVFVAGDTIAARRIVLALAAQPVTPALAGLEQAPRWAPGQAATSVLIVGSGAQAPAMAQAARAEGHRALLVTPEGLLPGFDAEAVDALGAHLRRAGIEIHEGIGVEGARVERCPEGFLLYPARTSVAQDAPIGFSHWCSPLEGLPPLDGLALEEASIAVRDGRPVTGAGLTTTNPRVLALGATRSPLADPATARAEAGLALAFMLARKNPERALAQLPRIVHGPLTLIEAGETEAGLAQRTPSGMRFYRQPLGGGGMLKVITDKQGRPLRIVALAQHAPGLMVPMLQRLADGRPLSDLASLPLPALQEADAVAALGRMALAEKLSTPGARLLLRLSRLLG